MIFLKILGVIAGLFALFLAIGLAAGSPEQSARYQRLSIIESDCERMREVAVTSYEKTSVRNFCEEAMRRASAR